ncbi:uncharacterized protein [Macrobrachium rosenbergii]|uniref:uncharacterized protein n=1 Tax=Macrobrachium rosenbergii TaxID=79674 RepID=UPI0034D43DD7
MGDIGTQRYWKRWASTSKKPESPRKIEMRGALSAHLTPNENQCNGFYTTSVCESLKKVPAIEAEISTQILKLVQLSSGFDQQREWQNLDRFRRRSGLKKLRAFPKLFNICILQLKWKFPQPLPAAILHNVASVIRLASMSDHSGSETDESLVVYNNILGMECDVDVFFARARERVLTSLRCEVLELKEKVFNLENRCELMRAENEALRQQIPDAGPGVILGHVAPQNEP